MTGNDFRSLNFREINLLLGAMDLTGAVLEDFYQPRPEELILGLSQSAQRIALCFVMSQTACRFFLNGKRAAKDSTKQRFVSFLYSRARHSRIESIMHVADERILKITLARGGHRSLLWVRLWSSAPNIIYTDEEGLIGDALFRRPRKGEISGGRYHPEQDFLKAPPRAKDPEAFPVRDFKGAGNAALGLHERVERYFTDHEAAKTETGVREKLLNQLGVEENRLQKTLAAAEQRLSENRDFERFREFGDILMADLSAVQPGSAWFKGRDFFHDNAPIEIGLETNLSPVRNAEKYYRAYKKAKAVCERTEQERAEARRRLAAVRSRIDEAQACSDAARLEELSRKLDRKKSRKLESNAPGLVYESQGFTILVGRTARENDELFRSHVRGNDFWMHARDYPGASVFIKGKKAKSLPLEVLLDAGHLAVFHSKARNSSVADLYYTQVKYLKKAKDGPPGLFLPTQEKNLTVRLQPERLERLTRIERDI